jgi:hypothetical protein
MAKNLQILGYLIIAFVLFIGVEGRIGGALEADRSETSSKNQRECSTHHSCCPLLHTVQCVPKTALKRLSRLNSCMPDRISLASIKRSASKPGALTQKNRVFAEKDLIILRI